MSDLNDFLALMASAKKTDPVAQKTENIKESARQSLGDLFGQLAEAKKQDPKQQIIEKVKDNVKSDLNNLFAQLAEVEVPVVITEEAEEHIDNLVEVVQALETEEIKEEVLIEVADEEPKTSVEKYAASLSKESTSFQQPDVPKVSPELKTITDKLKFLEQWVGKISAAGPGSGEVNLRWLDDVDRSTIGDNKYLRYNNTKKKFEFVTLSGGGVPQVQSDWDQLDDTEPSFIKNKPSLFSGDYDDLINTPTIPAAQIQSDWNQADNTALDFIKNKPDLSTIGDDTLDSVTDRGNTTTNPITVGSATADYFQVDITPATTPTINTGTIAWNPQELTFDMGLANGVVLQVGQETHMRVKAYEAISNGQAVMFAGVTGEHVLVRKYNPSIPGFIPEWFAGLATEDLAHNAFGYVTVYGIVHDVNTNAWNEGTILYADNSVAGGLTATEPAAGAPHIIVAAVTKKSGTGHLLVRPTIRPALADLSSVSLTSPSSGQVLTFDGSIWANSNLPSSVSWTNPSPEPSTIWRTSLSATSTGATIMLHEGLPGIGSVYTWAFDKTKITFPDSTQQTTAWTGTYSYNNLTDKPTLFSGSYTDLTDKPTIPSLTGYATESFVNTAITNLIGAAPSALDTLKEIADQLAADESVVSSLTTTVAGKVSLSGSYADPTWITSLAYSKLTGAPTIPTVPTNISAFTNDSGYLTSAAAGSLTGTTLNSTVVSSSLTSVGTLTSLSTSGSVTSNAATAFIAGAAAESGVALQMPREGALRDMTNGASTMYFDASNGGTTHGYFNFRSSSNFTSLLHLGITKAEFNPGMEVKAQTPYVGRTPFNSALDTVVTVDNLKYRISNQGGVFPQIASASGSQVDVCYDVLGVVNGVGTANAENSGYLLAANGTWLSIYSTHGMDARGDRLTAHITDKNAGKIYRATFMKTNNSSNADGYNIIVERIL